MSVKSYTFILFKSPPDFLMGSVKSGKVPKAASQSL